ncbi:S-layer homology domain-containing protein, partial [Paenibacillus sp. IB182496]
AQPYSELRVTLAPATEAEQGALLEAVAQLGAQLHGQPLKLSIGAVVAGFERTLTDFGHDVTLTTPQPQDMATTQGGFIARFTASASAQASFSPVRLTAGPADADSWTWQIRTGGLYAALTYDASFADMDGSWAADAVHRLASRLIVNGVDGDTFAPQAAVTRAELTAMVVRALGLPTETDAAAAFGDVDPERWYASIVATAAREGLVQGDADGRFRPDAPISRQETAALLLRALQWVGAAPAAGTDDALRGFADAHRIAPWARTAIADAVSAGLLQGDPAGRLQPQADITRAEAAAMLVRLLERMGAN